MNIHIRSHAEAARFLREHPGKFDVIFIAAQPLPDLQQVIEAHAAETLCLYFHDTVAEGPASRPPAPEDITRAIRWAEGRSNLLVACAAGVSRSSAVAYLLWCRLMPPQQAIRKLDGTRHMPNELVVRLGAEVLANPAVYSAFVAWRDCSEELWVVKAAIDMQRNGSA
jgi:predicted protein tyrosine phosphatase